MDITAERQRLAGTTRRLTRIKATGELYLSVGSDVKERVRKDVEEIVEATRAKEKGREGREKVFGGEARMEEGREGEDVRGRQLKGRKD